MAFVFKNVKSNSDSNVVYRDLALTSAKPSFDNTVVDLEVKENLSALRESVLNWFFIRKGSRPLVPEYGNRLHTFQFEPVTEINAQLVGEEVLSLEQQEPEIRITEVEVSVNDSQDGYNIEVSLFSPKLQESQDRIALRFSPSGIFEIE